MDEKEVPVPGLMQRTTQAPLVRLDRVGVVLSGETVLRDITWQLAPGERWGVVGANGSGKTSFLRLIAGTLWPAPGKGSRRYDFGGGTLTDAVRARREVALVGHELQDLYARWGWNFSALEVVLSGTFGTDVPRRVAAPEESLRATGLLRQLGIAQLAARPFLELSRGEQRRVLIARGLALDPKILLLDEPAAGLDAAAREELLELLRRVSADTAIVCSAHSAADLPPVVTRVLRIEEGRVLRIEKGRVRATARGRRGTTAGARRTRAAEGKQLAAEAAPTAAALPLIEITRADVWLGSRRVLSDLSWRLDAQQHWLVIGANGAGKSTFLRLLHGQLRPGRGGRIRWPALGDPRNVWQLRRAVAWVSPELQAGYRYPTTVRECVASGLDSSIGLARRLSALESARIDALLELFALANLARRRLTTLSYGQVRRALIARALVNRPRVLLLDEPWEGLDDEAGALVDAQLAAIIGAGAQLVCASHLHAGAAHAAALRRFTHQLELAPGEAARARELPSGVAMHAAHVAEVHPVCEP